MVRIVCHQVREEACYIRLESLDVAVHLQSVL
jgi:hypothetical protein